MMCTPFSKTWTAVVAELPFGPRRTVHGWNPWCKQRVSKKYSNQKILLTSLPPFPPSPFLLIYRYGPVIHEFDPWFNFRSTQCVSRAHSSHQFATWTWRTSFANVTTSNTARFLIFLFLTLFFLPRRYLVENGYEKFSTWNDDQVWWPLGR